MELRDYQLAAVEAARGRERCALALATGAGKTVIAARMADETPGRTLLVAHRGELVRQARDKVRIFAPDARERFTAATIQSLALDPYRHGRPDLLVVDECHHAGADTYRRVIDAHPQARLVGITATYHRGDGRRLDDVFGEVVHEVTALELISRGYLRDVTAEVVRVPDLVATGAARSDRADAEQGAAFLDSSAPGVVARALADADRGPAIVFAPDVASARRLAEVVPNAAAVWGAMPSRERERAIRDFDRGRLDCLTSVGVLTEGFDSPRARVCVLARPIGSEVLLQQMVGRVLRQDGTPGPAHVIDLHGSILELDMLPLADAAGGAARQVRERAAAGEQLLPSLLEVAERTPEVETYAGALERLAVDLFGASRLRWLRTDDGWPVLCTKGRFIGVVPAEAGGWNVGWVSQSGSSWGEVARDVPDVALALALGEEAVTTEERSLLAKAGRWRKGAPSAKALAYARGLGITPEQGWSAGDLGDAISVRRASALVRV